MSFETTYVIVAGVAWIRRSRVETSDGRVEESVWLVTFDGERSEAYKEPAGDSTINRGEVAGVGRSLDGPSRRLRRDASSALAQSRTDAARDEACAGDQRAIGDRVLMVREAHSSTLGAPSRPQPGLGALSAAHGRWAIC